MAGSSHELSVKTDLYIISNKIKERISWLENKLSKKNISKKSRSEFEIELSKYNNTLKFFDDISCLFE